MNNIENMNKIKILNGLKKPMRFNGEYFNTWEQFFNTHIVRVEKYKTDNMHKFNRVRFNRMDNNRDQDKYTENLKKEKNGYKAILQDGGFISISKFLYEGFRLLNDGLNINMRKVRT